MDVGSRSPRPGRAARRLRVRLLAAALLWAGLALPGWGRAAAPDPSHEPARPYIVKVHADWCGTCAMLEPTWRRIESEYRDRARLVVFDVTDRKRLAASRATAEVLGLEAFFDEYKSQTGTIAVLTAQKQTVAVLRGELDLAAYREAVDAALGS